VLGQLRLVQKVSQASLVVAWSIVQQRQQAWQPPLQPRVQPVSKLDAPQLELASQLVVSWQLL
jgi:hypothetical protein